MTEQKVKARFKVGEQAFIDGRDPQAIPLLTVSKINLWEDTQRQKAVGFLKHGTQVTIIDAEYHIPQKRWYYRVKHLFKTGWLPGVFLGKDKPAILGDLV